jgi:hypothetical protein
MAGVFIFFKILSERQATVARCIIECSANMSKICDTTFFSSIFEGKEVEALSKASTGLSLSLVVLFDINIYDDIHLTAIHQAFVGS